MPDFSIEGLSLRAYSRLKKAGLTDLKAVSLRTAQDLLDLPGFGRRSVAEVMEALSAVGLSLKPSKRGKPAERTGKVSRDQRRKAVGLYRSGYSLKDIGHQLGVSGQSIRWHLSKEISLRSRGDRGERYRWRQKAKKIQDEWATANEAARELGLDKSHVCAQCRNGRFLGAFRLDDGRQTIWLIPRPSIEAYRRSHPKKEND